jgi:hypothetical protein
VRLSGTTLRRGRVLRSVLAGAREGTQCSMDVELSVTAASLFQLSACLATTVVVAMHGVSIDKVDAEQEGVIRGSWDRAPLTYKRDKRAMDAFLPFKVKCIIPFNATFGLINN